VFVATFANIKCMLLQLILSTKYTNIIQQPDC